MYKTHHEKSHITLIVHDFVSSAHSLLKEHLKSQGTIASLRAIHQRLGLLYLLETSQFREIVIAVALGHT